MSKESAYFNIENLSGKHDLKQIKKELSTIRGVLSVGVNTDSHCVSVDFDNSGVSHERIEKCLNKMGYQISEDSGEEHIM
ncbi:cation transporter [Oscillospiraceae bacterium PP1C4]